MIARRLQVLGGIMLLLGGSLVLFFGFPDTTSRPSSLFDYEQYPALTPGDSDFPSFESHYPIRRIERFGIIQPDGRPLVVHVSDYQDEHGDSHRAVVYLPDSPESGIPGNGVEPAMNRLRRQAWFDAAQAIDRHVSDEALFISWWDNAQRIHFLTGRSTWVKSAAAELFDADHRDFWRRVSGGFIENKKPLLRLADWLTTDSGKALASMSEAVRNVQDVYLLVSVDDLARLSEIGKLSGQPAPFETRIFQTGDNIHTLIARVKRWAHEKGNGSYLLQRLPAVGVKAWRITRPSGEKTLLARLLPFTSSLSSHPPDGLELVYRSDWGGYLSIYRWRPSESVQQSILAQTPGGKGDF